MRSAPVLSKRSHASPLLHREEQVVLHVAREEVLGEERSQVGVDKTAFKRDEIYAEPEKTRSLVALVEPEDDADNRARGVAAGLVFRGT